MTNVPARHAISDDDVMFHLRQNTKLNQVRAVLSGELGRMEQAVAQRRIPTAIDMRRMEFEAVLKIAAELGVDL